MKSLYLIGGGGHCRSCIDVIEQTGEYKIEGIFDTKENVGKEILGYKIVGSDDDIHNYVSDKNSFLITVGQIKSAELRMNLYGKLQSLKAQVATIISPRAYVSKHAQLGAGTIVMHDALVNSNAVIGANCILNTKSLIEHDSRVADHCHISTAAVINGNCSIGEQSFVGSNSVFKEGVSVPQKSLIPAGSFYRGK